MTPAAHSHKAQPHPYTRMHGATSPHNQHGRHGLDPHGHAAPHGLARTLCPCLLTTGSSAESRPRLLDSTSHDVTTGATMPSWLDVRKSATHPVHMHSNSLVSALPPPQAQPHQPVTPTFSVAVSPPRRGLAVAALTLDALISAMTYTAGPARLRPPSHLPEAHHALPFVLARHEPRTRAAMVLVLTRAHHASPHRHTPAASSCCRSVCQAVLTHVLP